MQHTPCPTCKRPVAWSSASRWRPFCSDRCRLIDLGDWLTNKHAIAGEPLVESDTSDEHGESQVDPSPKR